VAPTEIPLGIDRTNYDGDYNGGQIVGATVGVVMGGPALIKGVVQGASAIAIFHNPGDLPRLEFTYRFF